MKTKLLYIIPSLLLGMILGATTLHWYETYKENKSAYVDDSKDSFDKLRRDVFVKGDVGAYYKLQGLYRDQPPEQFLFWAMYMANRHDLPGAYYDVYDSIKEGYNPTDSALYEMDDKTREFALHYLKLAAQKNNTIAIEAIKDLKNENMPTAWFK